MRFLPLAVLALLLAAASVRAAPQSPAVTASRIGPATTVRLPIVTPAMRRYSRIGYALDFAAPVYSLLLLWGVLATGLSARLRDAAERLSRRRFLTLLWYCVFLNLVLAVLTAPLIVYAGFVLDHQYGLSRQSVAGWLGDLARARLVRVLLVVPLLWLLFALIRRSPRRWALWFWAVLLPLIAFGLFLEPLLIEPLFNRFTPLPPGPLRTRIEALAARAGIPGAPILVADKSRQTNAANAYVTGLGATARIVLWDTTLRRMPDDQIVAVVGHEMGHYVHQDLFHGFLWAAGMLLIALPPAARFVPWLLARAGPRARLRGLTDPAAVPAFLLTLTLFQFLGAPVVNGLSRHVEHTADAYGLQVTGDRAAMARALVSLSEQNLSEPDPPVFVVFWLFDHPPLQERIDFALGRKSRHARET